MLLPLKTHRRWADPMQEKLLQYLPLKKKSNHKQGTIDYSVQHQFLE